MFRSEDSRRRKYLAQQEPSTVDQQAKEKHGPNKKKRMDDSSTGNAEVSETESRSLRLRESMTSQLEAAKFRQINQYLYSHSSGEVKNYMTKSLFDDYHRTYDQLAEKWPVRPIDHILKQLKRLAKKQRLSRFTIADLGCGKLPLIKSKIKDATVHSFDLVSTHKHVTAADMSNLPLDDASCDCVVCCLSLMNTNLKDCLKEANRILKTGGRLLIAEVVSRFEGNEDQFANESMKCFGFDFSSKTLLPPNSYFIYFDFIKKTDCKKSKLPDVMLKSCTYKPR